MLKISDTTGVILAGGRSSRFGENKAFASVPITHQPRRGVEGEAPTALPVEGATRAPMIDHIISVMDSVFQDLLLVTNTPEDYNSLHIPVVCDIEPYQGPLGGIVTAMKNSPKNKFFVVACDMPLLRADVIRQTLDLGRGHEVVVPVCGNKKEYLMALYSRQVLVLMEDSLKNGKPSLRDFCSTLNDIVHPVLKGRSTFNVNTREDLKTLEGPHAH